MTRPITGGCACGAIRYQYAAEPVAMLDCDCRDCQQSGAAPFASGIVVAVEGMRVSGTPRKSPGRGGSGGLTTRSFCAQCKTPLFTRGEVVPHPVSIRFATLDDQSSFRPMADTWPSSAQPWVCFGDGVSRYSRLP